MWLTALITFAVFYVGFGLLLCGCQRQFMYFPDPVLPGPDKVNLPETEAVKLHTSDGLELVSWLVRAPGAKYTAVVFHGNAGNISHRGFLADALKEAGCSTLLVEYRGYGGNPGSPSEQGLYRDARAALASLKARGDVDATRLIYFGKSLGSGPAMQLAVEHEPAALVLDSPFTSMVDVAAHHHWYLPVRWLVWDKYENLSKIGQVKCPVLVIHGDRDRIVPTSHGRKVFAAANEPKDLLIIPGGGHNDNVFTGWVGYIAALRRLVAVAEERRP